MLGLIRARSDATIAKILAILLENVRNPSNLLPVSLNQVRQGRIQIRQGHMKQMPANQQILPL